MAVVVLDTSVIIALRNEKDAHHEACMAVLANFDAKLAKATPGARLLS